MYVLCTHLYTYGLKMIHIVLGRKVIAMSDVKLTIMPKKYKGETATITTRLPAELIERIDDTVKKTGRTRNDIVQRFIEFAVENLEISEE